jgi:hypothetical protein
MAQNKGGAQLTGPIETTDTGSVLPMGVDFGRTDLNPRDLSSQKLRNHGYEF